MGAPLPEARISNFGTITVTVQRMTHGEKDVKYQWPPVTFEPIMKVWSHAPLPPGTEHTVRYVGHAGSSSFLGSLAKENRISSLSMAEYV